jgi:hypothetical protein
VTRVTAPAITVAPATITPACVRGRATYSLHAVASAPADAASIDIYVPGSDTQGIKWEISFDDNLVDNINTWQVTTSLQAHGGITPVVASGHGGDPIKWITPRGARESHLDCLEP